VPRRSCHAAGLWRELAERLEACNAPWRTLWRPWLSLVERRGPLARRMLSACGETPSAAALAGLCAELCGCLEQGRFYDP
jgi:hypothetical protein